MRSYTLGDPRQHGVDKRVVIGAALAFADNVERNLDRVFQLGQGLLEIQPLGRLEPLGQHDDRAALQPGQFGCLKQPAGFQGREQLVIGIADPDIADVDVAAGRAPERSTPMLSSDSV